MKIDQGYNDFFKTVEPINNHILRIHTVRGDEILFDFTSCFVMTRFADLKDDNLFSSVSTDGKNIIFKTSGIMPIIISSYDFLKLMIGSPIILDLAGMEYNP